MASVVDEKQLPERKLVAVETFNASVRDTFFQYLGR